MARARATGLTINRRVLRRGFFALAFRAVEVARDDLYAAVEVIFEQLHRAFDVVVFRRL